MLLVASFLGCGGLVNSGPPPPPPPVTVIIEPPSALVPLGQPRTFTAAVANSTNKAVTWSVNGIDGGNATVGTVSASGDYIAPKILPSPANVTVQAASVADPSKTASAQVIVTSDISVSVSPASTAVALGAALAFTATVNSVDKPNRAVTWTLSGSGCSGAACGIVDASGNYTAPQIIATPPIVALTAVSVADPSKSGTGTITLTSSFSLSVTGPTTLAAGNTATYAATLTPAANSNPSRSITWSVAGTGCAGGACGTISSTGVYVAPSLPPTPATVQIIATPQADPSKAVSVGVSIFSNLSVSISPSAAAVPLGGMQAFQATVTGTQDTTVTWSVDGVVNGNAADGSILNSQTNPDSTTYTAPLTIPSGGSVTVNARSNADPSIVASATVTFSAPVSVTLTPASATLSVNHRQSFTALANNTTNQNVAWQADGIAGGNLAVGQICVEASNPCQPVSSTNGGSVDYVAPTGVPSPNPVTITATSLAQSAASASSSVTILPHVVVSVQPGNVTIASAGQLRFSATVTGTADQRVLWSVTGAGCGTIGVCGFIDSSGLYTAPALPMLAQVVATSSEDTSQSGTALVTIKNSLSISSLSPSSAYAGSAGGFTLLVSGSDFSASVPGPPSTIVVAGTAWPTSCISSTQCITSLQAADLQSAANLSVQLQNPGGSLSNTLTFVVLAPGNGAASISLTPSAPMSTGDDIVVVDLSTNGGSGPAGNGSLNVGAIGTFSPATSSCVLGGSPVILQRPASGTGTMDVCVFSASALDPSFTYTVSGPPAPDIIVSNRAALGLGIVHLTLQVPATAAPGPRILFIENSSLDMAAGTGAIEVR